MKLNVQFFLFHLFLSNPISHMENLFFKELSWPAPSGLSECLTSIRALKRPYLSPLTRNQSFNVFFWCHTLHNLLKKKKVVEELGVKTYGSAWAGLNAMMAMPVCSYCIGTLARIERRSIINPQIFVIDESLQFSSDGGLKVPAEKHEAVDRGTGLHIRCERDDQSQPA